MAYTDDDLLKIWGNGKSVVSYDSSKYRKDVCEAWMIFSNYGNRKSKFGWEVDHIDPNGKNIFSNLRPLQWENNVAKSDDRTKCVVTSDGKKNVDIQKES